MDTTTELGIHDRDAEIADLRAENERLRAAIQELLLRHEFGGTDEQIVVAWERAAELIK